MFSTYQVLDVPTPQAPLNSYDDQRVTKNQTKQKRIRRTFSPEQLAVLEREFGRHQYKTRWQRFELSSRLKLNEQQILFWFQNRRMRLKKELKMKSKTKQLSGSGQEEFEEQSLSHAPPQTSRHPTTAVIQVESHAAYPPTPTFMQDSDESEESCEKHKLLKKLRNETTTATELEEIIELIDVLTKPTPPPSETDEPTDMQDFLKELNRSTAKNNENIDFTKLLTCMTNAHQNSYDLKYNPHEKDAIFRIEQNLLAAAEEYNRRLAVTMPAYASNLAWGPTWQPLPQENPYQVSYYLYH